MRKSSWSPCSVGAMIGLLSVATFFLFQKTLGTSTTFVKFGAILWQAFHKEPVESSSYFSEYLQNKSWIDWQMMLVIGIFIGAFLSKRKSKDKLSLSHPLSNTQKTLSFLGGITLMFGARLAGGCTSGHAISGGFQLALSGYLFMIGVFAVGIPSAFILYKKLKLERL